VVRDPGAAVQYTHTYTYDAVGNRLVRNDGGSPPYLGYGYDANDKLINTRPVGGGPPGPITANFYYDGAGNMTSVTGTEFGAYTMVYDDESRLKEVTYPSEGGSATDYYLQYNALGQRMRASLGGTLWRYVYNGDRLLEETTNSGGAVSRYTTESGSYYTPWLHLTRDGGHRFPVYDGVGTVRGLVDTAGAVTDSYDLDAFGVALGSSGSTTNPHWFGGAWGYMTEGSGLLQLGARFYWPEIGRFITQDPLRIRRNRYAYVRTNPVRRIDPTGLVDVFLGGDFDAVWGAGVEAGAGVVIDTDDWRRESGVYGSLGPAVGRNLGAGLVVGLALREIEGGFDSSANIDVNAVAFGIVYMEDAVGFNGLAFGVGPGGGVSLSATPTATGTWDDVKSLWQDVKDIYWWLTKGPCD
jgi:RHS repeat-associated protein